MPKLTLPHGPFLFSIEAIDLHVERNRVGAYVLLEPGEKPGSLAVARVGRSDTDVHRRLTAYLTDPKYTKDERYDAITHFSLGYLKTRKVAFDAECVLFHDWEPPLNEIHPGRPARTAHWYALHEPRSSAPVAEGPSSRA